MCREPADKMNTYIQVLKKYAVFNGRAARKEYWMYGVINAVIYLTLSAVLGFIGGEKGSLHLIAVVYLLATACPSIGVGVRRLHDTGKSGWWMLTTFIPFVGSFVLLALMVPKGTTGDNQYGPDPLQTAITAN